MADIDAIRIVNGEIKARDNVSKASVSLLSHLLDSPRLDEYKGKTPINELIPNDLKSAIRDIETEYLKPIFSAPMIEKGNTMATIEKQWQLFASGLREGGGYANAKSRVIKYFAHIGKLPLAENGKCLTVASIDKILSNEMSKVVPDVKGGIADKLVKLSLEIENRKETTDLGDYVTAIASLKSMLATYEGLYRETLENLTMAIGNTNLQNVAQMAIAKASEKPSIESIDAQYQNGQIDDTTYQIMMLEHHNIEIVLE
jgi:PBP1b-binding outer membrane lipoprotein LpoB